MSVRSFFDPNVLVYTDDKSALRKHRRALELVAEHRKAGSGVVSLQVLQEYFVTITRKLQVDAQVARRKVELLAELHVAAPEISDVLAAIDLHRRHLPAQLKLNLSCGFTKWLSVTGAALTKKEKRSVGKMGFALCGAC